MEENPRIRWASSQEAAAGFLSDWSLSRLGLGMPLLFLLSGGSTAGIAVRVAAAIGADRAGPDPSGAPLAAPLTFALADERYGREDHPDSNWRRLREAGFDPGPFPAFVPLAGCAGNEAGLEPVRARFAGFLREAVERRAAGRLAILGLFGIGGDGHTAGILPRSPAALLSSRKAELAGAYRGADFPRVTVTPAFLSRVDFALAWAEGEGKRGALERIESAGAGESSALPALFLFRASRAQIHTTLARREEA